MERIEIFPERPLKERGYRIPGKERLASMIAHMKECSQGSLFHQKLHKLLFFSDLIHFETKGRSISGLCYLNGMLGPIPEHGDLILELLVLEKKIFKREIRFPASDYYGTAFDVAKDRESSLLDEQEEESVREIVKAYKQATPKLLIDESFKKTGSQSPPFLR